MVRIAKISGIVPRRANACTSANRAGAVWYRSINLHFALIHAARSKHPPLLRYIHMARNSTTKTVPMSIETVVSSTYAMPRDHRRGIGMTPMQNRFNASRQIYESVESAILEAISPPVLGISVLIEQANNVVISIFVQGVLPEAERRFLGVVACEILLSLRWIDGVEIQVLDNAIQPLKAIGSWLFIRKGIQADHTTPEPNANTSIPPIQPTNTPLAAGSMLGKQNDSGTDRVRLPERPACQTNRRILRRRTLELRP